MKILLEKNRDYFVQNMADLKVPAKVKPMHIRLIDDKPVAKP